MKYMKIEAPTIDDVDNIAIDAGDTGYSFQAVVGNVAYDEFLASQNLTDEDVKALEPGVWYDMIVPTLEEVVAVDAE